MSEPLLKSNVSSEYVKLIEKVSELVHKISGNKLGERQAFMIETRLRKRMLEIGLKSPVEYAKYIDENLQKETGVLVGLITTHHTFFFREFTHFELLKKMLPELVEQAKKRGDKTIKVWSAASSRGQEAYSIAMFLEYYLPQIDPTMTYSVLGSDIDEDSVKIATNGVYHQNDLKEVPMNFIGNNWAQGTGDISMYAKVKDVMKKKVQFKKGNLMSPHEVAQNLKFDVIFCRNVFIYFEQHQIEKICADLMKYMQPHALFFSGISESLTGYKVEFSSVGPSAYRMKGYEAPSKIDTAKPATGAAKAPTVAPSFPISQTPDIYRIMCVDDSPSIHTLMKKILSKEEGFEIVAHAMNGKEAMEKMKTIKVDAVTLDIHMPEMDGIEYLVKNMNKDHPPVVMISSASRSDSDTAIKALRSGASDFVEKPSLQNLEEKGEEIRTKLKSAVSDRMFNHKISSFDIERSKHVVVEDLAHKLRVMTGTISDIRKMKEFFNHNDGVKAATIIFFEGQDEVLEALIREHSKDFKMKVNYVSDDKLKLSPGEIYFADMKKHCKGVAQNHTEFKTSIMCFGIVSKSCADSVMNWKNSQLLLEDMGAKQNDKSPLKDIASDIVPMTSFAYMSNVFFSKK